MIFTMSIWIMKEKVYGERRTAKGPRAYSKNKRTTFAFVCHSCGERVFATFRDRIYDWTMSKILLSFNKESWRFRRLCMIVIEIAIETSRISNTLAFFFFFAKFRCWIRRVYFNWPNLPWIIELNSRTIERIFYPYSESNVWVQKALRSLMVHSLLCFEVF